MILFLCVSIFERRLRQWRNSINPNTCKYYNLCCC